jgi:dihydrofolate synthase/folylpolyglutamate synthase
MTRTDSILERLVALHPKRIDLSLARMERLLAALGNPERHLPPTVHVAGTNGKGSTVAFLRAILEAGGLTVHAYTSPHLVRFHERFRLGQPHGGRFVEDSELAAILEEVEDRNGGEPATVFEVTTAAGFLLFARHPADALLLEVGLGGRLDATNVVSDPVGTIITPVSMDHAEFLGDTVEKIAGEKAGIVKPAVPLAVGPQTDAAGNVIRRQAARMRAPAVFANEDFHVHEEAGRLIYQDEAGLLDLPRPRLVGRHQIDNAGTVIAALRQSPWRDLSASVFERGLLAADWPARLHRLSAGHLADLLPAGTELWLDGGHNVDGGRVVAAAMADLAERRAAPLVLVVGMLATKDAAGFLANFVGLARHVFAVPIENQEKALAPDAIVAAARHLGLPADIAPGVAPVLRRIAAAGDPLPRILITGSLYLAGDVLDVNGTPPV